tara:strand:- start:722 stop:1870 length:1149 start_codon:yes stop_codon:yes gene_type:complete
MTMSFEEYVNAYYGGTLGISKRYGIRKNDLIETGDATIGTDAGLSTMYGAKVFSQLNTKSEVFKLLKKEPWTQSGWRVMTARHSTTNGVGEGGDFPATEHLDLAQVSATLKEVVTPWEMTSKMEMLSEADDGLGNLAAFMRKENGEAHAYYLDSMLLKSTEANSDGATGAGQAGNNFESLDRVTISNGRVAVAPYGNAAYNDIYTIDRSGASWSDAYTDSTSNTDKALTLAMIDDAVQNALENGANYNDLILLTGHDTYANLKGLMLSSTNNLLRANVGTTGAGNMNGVTGEAGLAFDSRVGSYDGIPIFVSQHCPLVDGATRVYVLDMANLAMRIAAPTTYVDNTNLAVRQKLTREYAFITAGELICYKFNTQGSIRDLTA